MTKLAKAAGLALGAADFIHKPFNVRLMRLRVGNLLRRVAVSKQLEEEHELRITLYSIGDGVITTGCAGQCGTDEQCGRAAYRLAPGRGGLPIDQVFTIVHERSRRSIQNPAAHSLVEERIVGLPKNTSSRATVGSI